jgi:hypothetical protein
MRAALSLVPPAILLAATIASAQPFSSFRRTDVAGVNTPRAIAAADITGDGWQDIVLGSTNPPAITLLQNAGIEAGDDGKPFKGPFTTPVTGGPFDLAIGDLNRDGKLDVAVANADADAITLLFGTGNGAFAAPVNLPFAGNPRGIAIGDFNRDAVPDIVATKFTAATVEVLYGAGDGTFPRRLALQSPRGTTGAQGVVAGDFDHDGWGDFAVASTSGSIRVYKMFATGAVVIDLTAAAVGWNVIAAADLDRDGSQDLAVASTGSSIVQVLYNRASGWTASAQIPVAASPRGIDIRDLNRDGRSEMVVAGRAASLATVITRADNGSFSTSDFASGSGARDAALADFDNDGRIDIATANEFGGGASAIYNTTQFPRAGFAFDAVEAPLIFDNSALGVADFDHNGRLDLVRQDFVEFDDGTLSRRLEQSGFAGTVADFNNDGHPDVVHRAEQGGLKAFFGNGARGFTDGPTTAAGFPGRLVQADFNRDGRADLAVGQLSGFQTTAAIEVWLGRGDGTFTRSSRTEVAWHHFDVGDVDRDGVTDLLVSSDTGVAVWLEDGRGSVKETKVFGDGKPWFGFALGDLNEDGRLDLAVVEGGLLFGQFIDPLSRFTIARGNGDGTFEAGESFETADPDEFKLLSGALLLGDLTGDGHLDVFTSAGDLFEGRGFMQLGERQRFMATRGNSPAVIADVNGDGLLDVAGYSRNDSEFPAVTMMNTTRSTNRPPVGLDLSGTFVWPYDRTWWDTDENEIDTLPNVINDPDMHALRHTWRLADGTVLSTHKTLFPSMLLPGTYQVTLTIDDYRGASISDTFTLDVPPFKETVLLPANSFGEFHGAWQRVEDPTASWGARMWHPDAGAPKLTTPLASPTDYFDLGFVADPTQEYKLWIRMKADRDHWSNDSVFVQFTGAKDAAGNPVYQIGTTSALAVNLEECSGCGESGWGWEDDGWGAVNLNGVTLRFPEGGVQTIRIQTREDGVSIDQIVLSSGKYKTTRPGTARNDTVKLDPAGPEVSPRR